MSLMKFLGILERLDLMLKTVERKMQLEQLDTHSGHSWRFEIDAVAMTVDIFKNGEHVRQVKSILFPVSDSWLEEQREGL